jgi:hypothetical protein
MWLAEHYDILEQIQDVTSHHPHRIRMECRAAGHEWAGETQHQKARKEKSVRSKRKTHGYSWLRVAREEGVNVESSGSSSTKLKAKLIEIDDDPHLFVQYGEDKLRAALVQYVAQKQPGTVTRAIALAPSTARRCARAD